MRNFQVAAVARNSMVECLRCSARSVTGSLLSPVGEARIILQGILLSQREGWT